MATPEIKDYYQDSIKNLNNKDSLKNSNNKNTVENDTLKVTTLSEDKAKEMVEKFLNAPETPEALSNLQQIEERYKSGSLPENVKNLYKKAKEEAAARLKDDFKDALKQVWVKIEWPSLLEIWKEDAKKMADGIVEDPETKKQVKDVKEVIFDKYVMLNPDQKKALDDGLKDFKKLIEDAKTEIWLA